MFCFLLFDSQVRSLKMLFAVFFVDWICFLLHLIAMDVGDCVCVCVCLSCKHRKLYTEYVTENYEFIYVTPDSQRDINIFYIIIVFYFINLLML